MMLIGHLFAYIFIKFSFTHDFINCNPLVAESRHKVILVAPCSNIMRVCKAQVQRVNQVWVLVDNLEDIIRRVGFCA